MLSAAMSAPAPLRAPNKAMASAGAKPIPFLPPDVSTTCINCSPTSLAALAGITVVRCRTLLITVSGLATRP